MSYTAYFQVTNNTGSTMSSGDVQHQTSSYGTQSCPFTNLGSGSTSPAVQLTTGPSSTDHWCFSFYINGVLYTGDKDCGVEPSDANGTITWQFNSNGGYNVIMPESSSCSGNWQGSSVAPEENAAPVGAAKSK